MDRVTEFETYRPLLFSIAYRMLGRAMDAEDAVQEIFLRWQRVIETDVQSPKAYLSAMVTRLCIDQLKSARAQREEYLGPWLPEPILTENLPGMTDTLELADSLSTAFLLLLENLSPVERAVFLLHDVFDYEYAEIAHIVGKSEANCRQLLKRAKAHLAAHRPRFDASPEEQAQLTRQFVAACTQGDMQGLLSLLADDVVEYSDGGGKVKSARRPIYGPDRVARLIFGLLRKAPPKVTSRIAHLNGQPGVISYLDGRPLNAITFHVVAGRIEAIYIVTNPDKLQRLPEM
jgi:RNA polymerase sigma-70 factor (ECF subfamily)